MGPSGSISKKIINFAGAHKKGLIGGGVGGSVIALILAAFIGLLPLKLVHIRQNVADYFDNRMQRSMQVRAGKVYYMVFDKEGNAQAYAKYHGNYLADKLQGIRTTKLINALASKGVKAVWKNGRVIGFDVHTSRAITPTRIDLTESTFSERRNLVRTILEDKYPEKGILRRWLNARRLYAAYGIKLQFFENTREKFNLKLSAMLTKLKQKIRNTTMKGAVDPTFNSTLKSQQGKNPPAITPEERATQGMSEDIQKEGLSLKEKLLGNIDATKYEVPSLAEALKKGSTGAVGGGIRGILSGPLIQGAQIVCSIKSLMNAIMLGARVLRAAPLARYAMAVMTAADTIKDGDPNAEELNALMTTLNGSEKSGGIQRVMGNKEATISTSSLDQFSIDPRTGAAGSFSYINKETNKFASATGGKYVCKVAGNLLFNIVGSIVNIGAEIFSCLGGCAGFVANAATGAILGALKTVALLILEPVAVNMVAGATISGDETTEQNGDAIYAGYDVVANSNARVNGGHILTGQQVAILDRTIATEDRVIAKQQSIFYRLFDLKNPRSLVSRTLINTPTSLASLSKSFTSYFKGISSPIFAFQGNNGKMLISSISGQALANTDTTVDPFAVDQYGFTDEEVRKYPALDNEAYILDPQNPDRKAAYDAYVTKCLSPDSQMADLVGQDIDYSGPCANPSEEEMRFRLYYLDNTIIGGLDWYTNNLDLQDNQTQPSPVGPSDYTADCPIGQDNGIQDGYMDGQKTPVRACTVSGGIQVSPTIATDINDLIRASKTAGMHFTGGGFRTLADQISTYASHHCSPPYGGNPAAYPPGGVSCPGTAAAYPGWSNHQMGLAIDFYNGPLVSCGTPAHTWLVNNARRYGLKPLSGECWHWSVDGH